MNTGLVIAVIAIVGMVALLVPLIIWFNKRANQKYAALWATLSGAVNGASKGNTLTGSYNGMPVQAKIRSQSDGDNSTDYYYELTITPGMQGKDWSLSYTGDKMLGFGAKSWHVKTRDEALKQRLIEAGVANSMAAWQGAPDVSYKAKGGALKYETQVNGMFAIPSLEQFTAQLDLLTRLAQVNQQVNVA
jgi:hypothetical protein